MSQVSLDEGVFQFRRHLKFLVNSPNISSLGNELIVHGERKTENEEKKRSETWSPLALFPRKCFALALYWTPGTGYQISLTNL